MTYTVALSPKARDQLIALSANNGVSRIAVRCGPLQRCHCGALLFAGDVPGTRNAS